MGKGSSGGALWRGQLQAKFCIVALQHAGFTPDCVFQLGLGDGAEVPSLVAAWPEARFVAVEGNPACVARQRERYPGLVISAAVGAEHGKIGKFHCARSRSKLVPGGGGNGRATVPLVTLDGLLAEHGSFGKQLLLWADIEGGELAAFQGGREFLKSVKFVWAETRDKPEEPWWPNTFDVSAGLKEHGFVTITRCGLVFPPDYLGDTLYCKRPVPWAV